MGRKLALIIGNSRYDDPGLARLATADVDVRDLADVLRAPDVGHFDEVVELPDQGLAVTRRSIAQFFGQGKRDDLLVFYFSGHGVKDENGHLYLAVRDTELKLLAGTSIESAFITALMDRSYSKRQVLILDCCHSGAFAYGAKAGAASAVGIGPAFEGTGYGHIVLTATDSTQYAWEGDQIIGESDKSVFTHYLLQGLKTGEADRDGDGLITIDELYDYVFEHVVRETPKQTPGKWSYKQQGDIVVARNPHPIVKVAELPLELQGLLENPLSRLRVEAVPELASLLRGRHPGLALAALKALEQLRSDDSRKVSAAAEEALTAHQQRLAESASTANAEDVARREQAEALKAAEEAERIRGEIEQVLAEASEQLSRQDLRAALAGVDAALQLDATSSGAIALRGAIQQAAEEARLKEELERLARERREQVAALIGRAKQAASHQAAIETLNQALALEPEHDAARRLLAARQAALEREAAEQARREELTATRLRIEDLIQRGELDQAAPMLSQAEKDYGAPSAFEDVRRRLHQKQHDRHASDTVEHARIECAAGNRAAAIEALQSFRPEHPVVTRALTDLRADLERIRRKEEERKRAEAERAAREQQIASLRQTALHHLERQRFVDALEALRQMRLLDPDASRLSELIEEAEAGKAAADEAERRRIESESRLADASKRFRRRDYARALAVAEEACRLDPRNAAADALRGQIQQALTERAATAGSTEWSAVSFVKRWRMQVALVAVVATVGLSLIGLWRRDTPQTVQSETVPAAAVPAPEQTQIQIETSTPTPAASSVPSPQTTPLPAPSTAPAPVAPNPRSGARGSVAPPRAETSRPPSGPAQSPAPVPAAPSGVETQIQRFLSQGDELLQARNYQAAIAAFEEAERLGSDAGRTGAEKARQERALQLRQRLSRAERLLDTGDYDDAIRSIDEALGLDPASSEGRALRQKVVDAQNFERTLRR